MIPPLVRTLQCRLVSRLGTRPTGGTSREVRRLVATVVTVPILLSSLIENEKDLEVSNEKYHWIELFNRNYLVPNFFKLKENPDYIVRIVLTIKSHA